MKSSRGTIQVYTGEGKGKTTAALGLALRATGHGQRALMLQFMKKGDEWGEVRQARRIQGLRIEQFGSGRFIRKGKPGANDIRLAGRGMKRAREAVFGGRYDLVILDEINVAVDFGLVKMRDVLDLMRRKPPAVELVLTGRGARALVVRKADTVSEVREVKHHFRKGIPARAGVEF